MSLSAKDKAGIAVGGVLTLLRVITLLLVPISLLITVFTDINGWFGVALAGGVGYVLFSYLMFLLMGDGSLQRGLKLQQEAQHYLK